MAETPRKIALDVYGMTFMDDYRIKVCRGVLDYARECAHWQILMNDVNLSLAHKFIEFEDLLRLGADGLIMPPREPELMDRILALGLPAVNIMGDLGDSRFPSVRQDDLAIGALAAHHFIEQGLRTLAFCGPGNWPWSMLRAKAFGDAARDAGCACHFFMPDHPDHAGYLSQLNPRRDWTSATRLRDWLAALPKPVGVMGCHDQRALHVLEACQDLGLSVPAEVAVIGVDDNLMLCESRHPHLSSIDLNAHAIGRAAAAMMERILAGEPLPEKHVIVPAKGVVKRPASDVLSARHPELALAMAFIGERFAEPISVEDVARAAGVSKGHLARCFRAQFHCSVAEEIRRRRLQRAQMLLHDRSLTIDEVARASGFVHASHLVNFFAARLGVSPGCWRKQFV